MRRRSSNPSALGSPASRSTLSGPNESFRTLSSHKSGPNLVALSATSLGAPSFPSAAPSVSTAPVATSALFRSETMLLARLYLDRAAAHATVDALGDVASCQFNDLNTSQTAFQRAFSPNIRRCDEMLRITRFLATQVPLINLTLAPPYPAPDIRLDDLDAHLAALERTLLELNGNADALTLQYNQTRELRAVLDKCAAFFREAPGAVGGGATGTSAKAYAPSDPLLASIVGEFAALSAAPTISVTDMSAGGGHGSGGLEANGTGGRVGASGLLSFLTGTIGREKVAAFERLLFRITRGNCIVRFADLGERLVDPDSGEAMEKSVFMVFYAGVAVRAKIAKVCDSFAANRYQIPEDHRMQMSALEQCGTRLSELDSIASVTRDQRRQTLVDAAANLGAWRARIKREMAIFHVLNLLNYDTSNRLFIAEVWCPSSAEGSVRAALDVGRQRSSAQVSSVLEIRNHTDDPKPPPTHFETNKFTEVFQAIVDSYGIAKYKEVNPAPYSVITFPFLFAVMFGDVGHGIVMALFAGFIVLDEARLGARRRQLDEVMGACYDARYLILMMGLFSIYTGFIYNEFFAIPLDLFGSRWKFTAASSMACGVDNCDVPASVLSPIEPYPLGFDPVWKASKTGLVFFNSYKMKLSIVLGVCQMVMGICLSYSNATFFKSKLDVLFVFIPQLGFMLSIFGYLVFLIIYKWCKDFSDPACLADPNCLPPDLKATLIGMIMSPGSAPPDTMMFAGQNELQLLLIVFAVVCVPWMLLPKPLILRARHRKRKAGYSLLEGNGDVESEGGHHGEPFDFGEIFVHQMIHTIEFVLGAVSNTASYLRLWALSLAHAELSNVFLEKLLFDSISSGSPMLMIIGFFMWALMTVGVLLSMEALSAFLHALRLHWVEFQNKFYLVSGDGRKFEPFDHANEIED